MSTVRQILLGILAGLISLTIILGGLTLAIAEGATTFPQHTATPLPLPTVLPGDPTLTPSPTPQATGTPTATPRCPIPPTWVPILIPAGADLNLIAAERGLTVQQLLAGNCLTSLKIDTEIDLYAPPILTATPSPTPSPSHTSTPTLTPTITFTPLPQSTSCVVNPTGTWVIYIVQSGDTLFTISQNYYTTVFEIQRVNCMIGITRIVTGQRLYVPNVLTRTPTPSITPSATFTPTFTPTVPTNTPTITPTFTPTPTPTAPPPSPTPTETPSSTPTLVPSDTPIPTDTPTPIPPTPTP